MTQYLCYIFDIIVKEGSSTGSLFLPITEIKCSAKLNWNTLRHLTRSLSYLTRILSQDQFSSTFHFIQINQLWINTLTHNRLDSFYQIATIFTFLVIWYDTQYHCLLLSLQSLLTLYLEIPEHTSSTWQNDRCTSCDLNIASTDNH